MIQVLQREQNDCAVAALAMAAGISYEEAYEALDKVNGWRGHQGTFIYELEEAVEKHLGFKARRRRKYDPKDHRGIISARQPGEWHFLGVAHGKVACPAGGDPDSWRWCTLLEIT